MPLFRVVITLVLALALVPVGSSFLIVFASSPLSDNAYLILLLLLNLVAIGAAVLALCVAWLGPVGSISKSLSISLAAAIGWYAVALVPTFSGQEPYLEALFGSSSLDSMSKVLLWTLPCVMMMRFSAVFPSRLTDERLRLYWENKYEEADHGVLRLLHGMDQIDNWLRFIPGRGKRVEAGAKHVERLSNRLIQGSVRVVQSDWVWGVVAVVILLAALGSHPGAAAPILYFATVLLATMLIPAFALPNYMSASAEDRGRILWMTLGLIAGALAICGVIGGIFGVVTGLAERGVTEFPAISFSSVGWTLVAIFPLPLALSLLVFTVAIFFHGAIDPALGIRRTTVYGALGILFLFLFAGLGNAGEGLLESSLGLPPLAGSIITGGTIAVVLIPVKRHMDGYMRRILPATVLSEAPKGVSTIVFSDIVDYTRLSGEDQTAALTVMTVLHKVTSRLAREHGGRVVKTVADEVMLEFREPRAALTAASELQGDLEEELSGMGLPVPQLRTGVHLGEVTRSHDGDLFGDTVNVASKIHTSAEPGEVVVTSAVVEAAGVGIAELAPGTHDIRADEVDGTFGADPVSGTAAGQSFRLEPLGARHLKNVAEPVECYRLV